MLGPEVGVGDLTRVLARAAIDEVWRGLLEARPRQALRGYTLDEHELALLTGPADARGPLLARAAAELGIDARSWDATDAAAGPDAHASAAPERPPSPLDGLPDVSLQLRLAPARAPDGRTVWSISLVPPGQALPPKAPGEARPHLRVRASDGHVSAWVAPEAPAQGPEPDLAGPRWSHRVDAPVQGLAQRVVQAPPDQRPSALHTLLAVATRAQEPPSDLPPTAPDPLPVADSPDIVVIGLGITGVDQLTRQAESALRRARCAFSVDTSPGVRALLAARCPRVEPLFERTYRSGAGRLPTYLDIAARVLSAALEPQPGPVVLAVQGHPTVFSYVPVLLRDVGLLLGLRVQIQPGVSSQDGLLARLALDPADHGIQAFEATDLLLRRRPVDPHQLTLVWQVGTLETRLHTGRPSRPERLHGLVRWLSTFFPSDHPVTAVGLPAHPSLAGHQLTVPLHQLPQHAPQLHAATTLVIPPLARRPLADAHLARAVDDPAHLAAITRPAEPDDR